MVVDLGSLGERVDNIPHFFSGTDGLASGLLCFSWPIFASVMKSKSECPSECAGIGSV